MIDGLIAGKLQGQPFKKTSKNGKPFVVAKVRVPSGDDHVFVNVITFSEPTGSAMLALDAGEAVALVGELKPTAWVNKEGNLRAGLDMTATEILTTHHITKKRKAVSGENVPQRPRHDAWIAGSQQRDGLDDGSPLDF